MLKAKQYSQNGAAMTQTSVINTIITQKHAKRKKGHVRYATARATRNGAPLGAREQTNKQAYEQTHTQTNIQTNK